MGELTPPGFEYMVSLACLAPSSLKRHRSSEAVFRLIWAVESLCVNYWAECDTGDNQQEWKQLEGLPLLVCSQRSWVSCGVDWYKRAERKTRGSAVGRGEARNRRRHGVFGRESS
jgi:hypothetical protein